MQRLGNEEKNLTCPFCGQAACFPYKRPEFMQTSGGFGELAHQLENTGKKNAKFIIKKLRQYRLWSLDSTFC
jgi:hypothetical protein